MGYIAANRRQKRKDTSIIFSQRVLFYEARFTYNATVVDDAIRFVSNKSKDKKNLKSANEDSKEESKEPDYDEDQDQLEKEQKGETGEITTNYIF